MGFLSVYTSVMKVKWMYSCNVSICTGEAPNYYPNSFSGPVDSIEKFGAKPVDKVRCYCQPGFFCSFISKMFRNLIQCLCIRLRRRLWPVTRAKMMTTFLRYAVLLPANILKTRLYSLHSFHFSSLFSLSLSEGWNILQGGLGRSR